MATNGAQAISIDASQRVNIGAHPNQTGNPLEVPASMCLDRLLRDLIFGRREPGGLLFQQIAQYDAG